MKAPLGTATRSDQWLVIVLSAIVSVTTLWTAARRVVEILPNEDVPVDVQFDPTTQPITIEGVGTVSAEIDHATVTVPDLPIVSWLAALGGVIVPALAIVGIMVCVAWLCRHLMTGEFFSRTNTRLLTSISMLIVLGWVADLMGRTFAGNSALARLAEDGEGFALSTTLPLQYLFVAIVVGCIAAAFHAGERMQRDAEGLV